MSDDHAPLIGMVGYAQAGKDTFARYLGFEKRAFANALRDLAYDSNAWYRENTLKYGYEWCKANVHGYREYLQDFGMAMRAHFGEDVWVNLAFKGYDPGVPTVFTDVRFPNEIAEIRRRGGLIVRIDRQGHAPANGHISEFAWQDTQPDEHFTFANGALRHMELVAISLAERLLSKDGFYREAYGA